MKLLFITCLQDFKEEITQLMKRAGVSVYSIAEMTGIKNGNSGNLLDDWFGVQDGLYNSLMIFSFTTEEAAYKAMQHITEYNQSTESKFPVRVFIMPVEATNYNS